MADKDPMTSAAEAAAKELIKTAYGDLLQPAAREIGSELKEFVVSIMIAGRGFGYLIRERYEPFLLSVVKRVPKERQILPSPAFLGRILESISYESDRTKAYEMSKNLLAAAMDESTRHTAHNAFIDIIHKISDQEINILHKAKIKPISVSATNKGASYYYIRYYCKKEDKILCGNDVDLLFDNLRSAGLINFFSSDYVPTHKFRDLEDLAHTVRRIEIGKTSHSSYNLELTPFGRAFMETCVSDNEEDNGSA